MKIQQIVPAQPGWHLATPDYLMPVMCWALVDDPGEPGSSIVVPVVDQLRVNLGMAYLPEEGRDWLQSPDESYEYVVSFHGQPDGNWRAISVAHAETDEESVTATLWCRPLRDAEPNLEDEEPSA